jgi:acyl-CoA thioester hydrolase
MSSAFIHRLRVRYHETDAQQHVYNSRYLEYVDIAFTEFIRHLGSSYPQAIERGFDPILARAEIDFRQPALFDDEVEILVQPRRLGSSSLDIEYLLRGQSGEVVAEITIVYVNFDSKTRRTVAIPVEFRDLLEARIPAQP